MFFDFAAILLVEHFECFLKVFFEDHVIYIKRCCQKFVHIYSIITFILVTFSILDYIIQCFKIA